MIAPILIVLLAFGTLEGDACSPPEGYEPRNGRYYKLHQTPAIFITAKATCQAEGAELAQFESQLQYEDVKYYANLGSSIWIGLLNKDLVYCTNAAQCTDKMYWINGTKAVSGTYWNGFDGNDAVPCVRMERTGYMGDKECEIEKKFLCEFKCESAPPLTCSDGRAVPDGFEVSNVPAKYFKLYFGQDNRLSNSQAELKCATDNARLAGFKTLEQYTNLRQYRGYLFQDHLAVGLRQTASNDTCVNAQCSGHLTWSDTSGFQHDESFMTSNVLFEGTGPCAQMSADYSVVSVDCSTMLDFVCEFDCESSAPVDGSWSSWDQINECTNGALERTKIRTCINPAPINGGQTCEGTSTLILSTCPSTWTAWGSWTPCSKTCDVGHQTRVRQCSRPNECPGQDRDIQYCVTTSCPFNYNGTAFRGYEFSNDNLTTYMDNMTAVDLSLMVGDAKTYCAGLCFSQRDSRQDYGHCNTFRVDGKTCHFGYVSPSFPFFNSLHNGSWLAWFDLYL